MKALWTEPRATLDGTYYQLRQAIHEPKPVQKPHPPRVIGTRGERVGLRIAARHADVWNMANGTADEVRTKSGLLDQYCKEIDRDPAEIERSIQFLPDAMTGDVVAHARDFIAAGAQFGELPDRRLDGGIVDPDFRGGVAPLAQIGVGAAAMGRHRI